MSVSRKNRRTVTYKDQIFVWWVCQNEDDENRPWLNIISDDKKISLAYRVGEGDFFVVSKGTLFQGRKTTGCWERYWYPMKEPPMVVTPKFVSELIAWAVEGQNDNIYTAFYGRRDKKVMQNGKWFFIDRYGVRSPLHLPLPSIRHLW